MPKTLAPLNLSAAQARCLIVALRTYRNNLAASIQFAPKMQAREDHAEISRCDDLEWLIKPFTGEETTAGRPNSGQVALPMDGRDAVIVAAEAVRDRRGSLHVGLENLDAAVDAMRSEKVKS